MNSTDSLQRQIDTQQKKARDIAAMVQRLQEALKKAQPFVEYPAGQHIFTEQVTNDMGWKPDPGDLPSRAEYYFVKSFMSGDGLVIGAIMQRPGYDPIHMGETDPNSEDIYETVIH